MAEQLSQEESLDLEQLDISRLNQIAAIFHNLGRKELIAREELLENQVQLYRSKVLPGKI